MKNSLLKLPVCLHAACGYVALRSAQQVQHWMETRFTGSRHGSPNRVPTAAGLSAGTHSVCFCLKSMELTSLHLLFHKACETRAKELTPLEGNSLRRLSIKDASFESSWPVVLCLRTGNKKE